MMDYCQGGDLEDLITQCRTGVCTLSTEAVVNCAKHLASGLCFLHENQFIHGDLKPGNVFMDRATDDTGNLTLRIGDLDNAVRIRDNCARTERKDLAGTGPYMSPEMVMQFCEKEHEDIGFATDVWSLGCVVLDLANCSVGIKERIFYRTVTNSEGNLETEKIDRQSFSADQFLFRLSKGFHPFISERIHQDTRDLIQRCLVPACTDRATAAVILDQLLNLNLENGVPTLCGVKKYGIPQLFDICAEYATKTVDKRTCLPMLEAAKVLNAEKLVTKCLEIVDTHGAELLQSEGFLQLKSETLRVILSRDTFFVKEDEVYKAAQRWAKNACRSNQLEPTGANCRAVLGEALFAVRFPLMDNEQLASGPLAVGLLLDEEVRKMHEFKYAAKKPDIPFLSNPRAAEIAFCDRRWSVMTLFDGDTTTTTANNVFLDQHGHLHLRLTQHGDVWKGAEVQLKSSLGFGRCEFHIEGLDRLEPDSTFELLAENGSDDNGSFIGINFIKEREIGKSYVGFWIQRSSSGIARSSADPASYVHVIKGGSLTTHSYHRKPGSVSFSSQRGHQRNNTAAELCSWSCDSGPDIPRTALSLSMMPCCESSPEAPYSGKEVEVIVHSFRFYPDN